MRDVLIDRAKALIKRMGVNVSITTVSGVHSVRGIHRAPHTSPELGYGMSNQATSDMLNILMGDVPDIARESRVTIDNKVYDVIEVQPDEYHVMASLALMEA